MTERTGVLSKVPIVVLLALAIAGMALLLGWANERYIIETQRDCMASLERPDPSYSDYDDKMLKFAEGVKECLG